MMSALMPEKSSMKVKDASFTLRADSEWSHDAIATRIINQALRRVKWKPKNDAWLQLNLHNISAPVFVFEHKCKESQGKAFQKAILMAQLCWRRLYLAVCVAADKKAKHSTYANEMLRKHLVWFAALEGSTLYIGAVRGIKLENPKQRSYGVKSFDMHYEFTCSHITIQVLNDMARAVSTMTSSTIISFRSRCMKLFVSSEARIESKEMTKMEKNFREVVSVNDSSKPFTSSNSRKRQRSRLDRESDGHSGPPLNRQGRQQQSGQPFQGGQISLCPREEHT
jgi:hypothetical protein